MSGLLVMRPRFRNIATCCPPSETSVQLSRLERCVDDNLYIVIIKLCTDATSRALFVSPDGVAFWSSISEFRTWRR